MRLAILFASATLIALTIQTAMPLWFPFQLILPNLVVILAVDLGLRHHGALPAVIAFAMGYAVDAFSGVRIGLNAFLVTVVFLFSYEVSTRLMVTNALVGALAVFVGAIIVAAGGIAVASKGNVLAAVGAVMPHVLIQAAISAAVAPMVFALLKMLKLTIGLPAKAARE